MRRKHGTTHAADRASGRQFCPNRSTRSTPASWNLLQDDASLSIAEIAEKVGLSSSPAWRRIERLKKAGVILKQVTLLDHEKLGLTFEVFASVKLAAAVARKSGALRKRGHRLAGGR
jgi:predicted ArsR family transcriptional regulator